MRDRCHCSPDTDARTLVVLISGRHGEVTLLERAIVALVLSVSAALMPNAVPAPPSGAANVGVAMSASPAGVWAPNPGSYSWPVVGPVIRGYVAPPNQYGAGHRGIDIAVPFGTPVRASNDGVVAFAGWVAGSLYVSIDHPDGVRTTYSWLSAVGVRKGQPVRAGDVIGASGHGHPEIPTPHLHFGARIGDSYIDPMILLGGASVADLIRLAPFEGPHT